MSNKKIIIGLDGAPHQMIERLAEQGTMKNLSKIKNQLNFKKMQTSIPIESSVSWSSIITGKNPGQHGVYGFSDIIQGTYSMKYHNIQALKQPTYWDLWDGKHIIINVPATYPAQEINGAHISGFVSPNYEKAIQPNTLIDKLKEINYQIDIDSEKAQKSPRLLFEKLFEVLEARIKAYRYLWDEYDWNTFTLIFTGTDRLEHFLWNAYQNKDHEYHEKFLKFYSKIDQVIGEIWDRIDEEDTLLMLSDHGMEQKKKDVNLNQFLQQENFLKLGEGNNYNRIKEGSKAFAMEHGRIYLNTKKYPRGTIKPENKEQIIEELINSLKRITRNGEPIIKDIYRKNEIFHGDQVGSAPDLVAIPEKGYNLRGKIEKGELFEESSLQGMHNENAFILTNNSLPKNPHVEDVINILEE